MDLTAVSPSLLQAGTEASRMSGAEAAKEFEAMIVTQMLKAAREASKALGTEEGEAGMESYLEFAEQHLGRLLARDGFFGFEELAPVDSEKE